MNKRLARSATAVIAVCMLALVLGVTGSSATVLSSNKARPLVGFFQDDGSCRDFTAAVKLVSKPNVCLYFQSWVGAKLFPTALADELAKSGQRLMVSWQPWDSSLGHGRQSLYSLGSISRGRFDKYITNWAHAAASFGKPIYLRFAHEMNGPWYPWGFNHVGNSASGYVRAWRHIHNIFVREGATNVRWVWAPYAVHGKANKSLAKLYPGDRYVDVLGPAGYARRQSGSYGSVFAETISALERLSSKPIVISETSVTNAVPLKLKFIQSFFVGITKDKRVRGFVWFDSQRPDSVWRIRNPKLVRAFRSGVGKFVSARVGGR